MDFSEIMARVRDWLTSVGNTLGFVLREKRILVITIFVILSIGIIVWARFGFRLEIGRFFAVNYCAESEIGEQKCNDNIAMECVESNNVGKWESNDCSETGDICEDGQCVPDTTTPTTTTCSGSFPYKRDGKCYNASGQVRDYPTTYPDCFVWELDVPKYTNWLNFGAKFDDDKKVTDGTSDPRLLEIEGNVIYNNCTWPVGLITLAGGSVHKGNDAVETHWYPILWDSLPEEDVENSLTFEPMYENKIQLPGTKWSIVGLSQGRKAYMYTSAAYPSCKEKDADCENKPFKVSFDISTYNCGRVYMQLGWLHGDSAEGLDPFDWHLVPFSDPLQWLGIVSDQKTTWTRNVSGRQSSYTRANPIEGSTIANVFNYGRDCTDALGELRPGDAPRREPAVKTPVDGNCSKEIDRKTCDKEYIFNHYKEANGLPPCEGAQGESCGVPANCIGGATGEASCITGSGASGGPSGGSSGGRGPGGSSSGGAPGSTCEANILCPSGTTQLGAARNGAEFVDDSNLGWFDFYGGTLTLVCGRGLAETNGKVYVGPPPPRKCPDGRDIPTGGDYGVLRATNISSYCFGDRGASFDLSYLNPLHTIDCSQHETGYYETYDIPQGKWFFGSIGPGTATAAACSGGTVGSSGVSDKGAGTAGGEECEGECSEHTGGAQPATLSATCSGGIVQLSWQDPKSLNARVNSMIRNVNGANGEFVFGEGGCWETFGISTYNDQNVSAGNEYMYRIKTAPSVVSNTVTVTLNADGTCGDVQSPTPTDTVTPTPPPGPTCGDGICSSSESCSSCANDCGTCSATCGDDICSAGESCSSCADDCGTCGATCGDGVCDNSESCSICSNDCGVCRPGTTVPIGPSATVPTGPGEATFLALVLSGLTALLYVSYTHTAMFRRREAEKLEQDQGPMDFRT